MTVTVAIADLGMGNLRSVERALAQAAANEQLACVVVRTKDPEGLARADKIVVPGQGAFRDCAKCLSTGMGDALREAIARGVPYLGICLGLQALFDASDEAPSARGLGVFRGVVRRIEPAEGIKIPHMGWNAVTFRSEGGAQKPFAPFVGRAPHFYFVHSYHAVPEDQSLVAGVTQHGPHEITAAVQRDNVLATQFHPEKSQADGLTLLARFLKG